VKNVIVLIAHGTVSNLDDLEAFVTEIRRGRPPPPGLLHELRSRYEKVGGSPLLRLTRELAAAVERRTQLETRVAMRLWDPRLRNVVADLATEDRVILVPLAPFSVGVYRSAAEVELGALAHRPRLITIQPFGCMTDLVGAWCDAAEPLLNAAKGNVALLQSAHSLPQAVIDAGDLYEREFRAAALLVRDELTRRGVPFNSTASSVVFQSQGAQDGAWLGPTLLETMQGLPQRGVKAVCVLPMGFLSEHIETLYDLDVEASEQARALGLEFVRAPALNCAPGLVAALDQAIRDAMARDDAALCG
jgi:protoporphyrin/coproporphyrin ferrochelatase